MLEKSCGTIPYTKKNGQVHYLLIKIKENGCCGFPKGHIDSGETEEETALRETWEETSLKVSLHSEFRHELSYRMPNGNQKNATYFLADFGDQLPINNEGFENFDYLILPFEEAVNALTFENSRQMLKEAHQFILAE